ncbi:hypothetical protein V9K67_13485 [Paraflavisolibacter sp. H34]|uniref:hypothetical protein n=1 Tax=Huijunlia imazamoxiresistens TaxID=3127457 RepID=UPI0030192C46
MKDLLAIIIAERRTLLRGHLVSFILVFPFTFLPILADGLTWTNILHRFPFSVLYAFGFSLFAVVAAVVQNYNNLVKRKKLFDKPAFKKLDFYGRLDGVGSIVRELETFLLGKLGKYYFRINLVDPEQKTVKIEIIPFIDLEKNKELKAKLKKELGFQRNLYYGQTISASEADLQNENFLLDKLLILEAVLNKWNVTPLNVEEYLRRE